MSITLKKYKEEFSLAVAPRIFHHTDAGSDDITPYYVNESLSINKRTEFDTTFSFAVSYGELIFGENDILNEQLTDANFENYLIGIEIKDVNGRSFAGQIDSDFTYFDEENKNWVVGIKDWLKYHLDYLSSYWWDSTYANTEDFLAKTFTGSLKAFSLDERYSIIQNVVVKTRNVADWDTADQEWILYKGQNPNIAPYNQGDYLKTHTISDLLLEAQKHYGAYVFIDENLAINFVNTQYALNVYPSPFGEEQPTIDITNRIYTGSFTQMPYKKNEYDGILISQEEKLSDILTEISWRMLRYVDGEVEETRILSEEQIAELPENLRLIDLRQDLGWVEKTEAWDEIGSKYDRVITMGFKMFPQRQYADTLKDYELLIKPLQEWECLIEPKNITLFNPVAIDGTEFQVHEINLDGVEKEDRLMLRKVAEGAL